MPLHRLTRGDSPLRVPRGTRPETPYQRNDVEEWFLSRGMPTVARSSSSFRNLLLRVSPVLIGYCVLFLTITLSDVLLRELRPEAFRTLSDSGSDALTWGLVSLGGAVVLGLVAGLALNRFVRHHPLRVKHVTMLTTGAPLLVLLLPFIDTALGLNGGHWAELIGHVILIAILLVLTRMGLGAILIWSIRQALTQGVALTSLAARALPMILLVTLFSFFSEGMWVITGSLSRGELWNVVLILLGIAGIFVWTVIRDEMRSMTENPRCSFEEIRAQRFPADQLAGEPRTADQPISLTRRETGNALAILLIAQGIQLGSLVMLVFTFFCLFGSIAVPPAVVEAWTGHEATSGSLMGVPLPVHNELIQTSLFLAAFSAVSFAASSVTDPAYRQRFFDPLLQEMAVTVTARHLYRASSEAAPVVETVVGEGVLPAPATTRSQ